MLESAPLCNIGIGVCPVVNLIIIDPGRAKYDKPRTLWVTIYFWMAVPASNTPVPLFSKSLLGRSVHVMEREIGLTDLRFHEIPQRQYLGVHAQPGYNQQIRFARESIAQVP